MLYKRVLLKLSGEALAGPKRIFPYDPEIVLLIAREIQAAYEKGVEIAIVPGGGNIFRGAIGASKGMDRVAADQFGMLATVQNGIALYDLLVRVCKVKTRLMTGLRMDEVAEPYLPKKAIHHLDSGRVIILAGGTGHGFCSTDYAAALRASEIGAQLIAKATNVNGIYDKDPNQYSDAKLLSHVDYDRCIAEGIKVMDTEAFSRCRDGQLPIRVFSLNEKNNISAVLTGANLGTLVSSPPIPA